MALRLRVLNCCISLSHVFPDAKSQTNTPAFMQINKYELAYSEFDMSGFLYYYFTITEEFRRKSNSIRSAQYMVAPPVLHFSVLNQTPTWQYGA